MNSKLKNTAIQLLIILLSALVLALGYICAKGEKNALDNEDRAHSTFETARVISIDDKIEMTDIPDSQEDYNLLLTCKMLSGADKGKTVHAIQNISSYLNQQIRPVTPGDKIILTLVEDAAGESWYFAEYVRSDMLAVLLALFILGLVVFGKMSGVKTVISLALTCGAVFYMLIPAIYSGQSAYLWSIIVCLYIIVMTLCIVNGLRYMSLATGLGCVAGIVFVAVMMQIADKVMKLTGFLDETSMYLSFIDMNGPVDLKSIVFASVTIGCVGAVMDVAVDISAALHEIAMKLKKPSFSGLIESGFNIGHDIMGTMSNTLILAHIGSSISFVLLVIYNSSDSMLFLFNREIIVAEGLKILIGSLGILMTIPLSTLICAFLYTRRSFIEHRNVTEFEDENDESTAELSEIAASMHGDSAK